MTSLVMSPSPAKKNNNNDDDDAAGGSFSSSMKRVKPSLAVQGARAFSKLVSIVTRPLRRAGSTLFTRFFLSQSSTAQTTAAAGAPPMIEALPGVSLFSVFLESRGGRRFLRCVPFKIAQDMLSFSSPVLVAHLVRFIKSGSGDVMVGLQICFLMLVILTLQTVVFQAYLRHLYRASLEATVSAKALVLHTCLSMPLHQRATVTEGDVISCATVEATRVGDTLVFLHNAWGHPMIICIGLFVLKVYVGYISALCTFAAVLLMIPLNKRNAVRIQEAQKSAKGSAARVSLINEGLSQMRLIRANAYEETMLQKILDARDREVESEDAIQHAEAVHQASPHRRRRKVLQGVALRLCAQSSRGCETIQSAATFACSMRMWHRGTARSSSHVAWSLT